MPVSSLFTPSVRRNFLRRAGRSLAAAAACTVFTASFAAGQASPDIARGLTGAAAAQGRLLWVDGTANIVRHVVVDGQKRVLDYTTTEAGVNDLVAKAKAAHINTLVVDVKPLGGEVLYNSKVAPHLREWQGHAVPDFDVLAAFITAGHKAGMLVDADINILSEGHKFYGTGPAYHHPDWQCTVYSLDRGLVSPGGERLPIRAQGEPGDSSRAELLSENSTVLAGEPTGMVGLDVTGSDLVKPVQEGPGTYGKQLNVVIDGAGRVTGVVDNALLGDDPLTAPPDGWVVTTQSDADRAWVSRYLAPGTPVRFDMKTAFLPIAQAPAEKVACFVNPLNSAVRQYELNMVREIVTNYDVDGLVLDRCRYSDLYTDFSDTTRAAFEQFIGHPVARWPQDVYTFSPRPGGDLVRGPLFSAWLRFRAGVIRDFAASVAQLVRSAKPGIALGTYVGSWYPDYYEVGVNWGSPDTSIHYSWFPPHYRDTGYAEYFDWVSTGCYYPVSTREEAKEEGLSERGTVEYASDLSSAALANGSILYPGIYVPDYAGKPQELLDALKTAAFHGEGVMIFDSSHLDELNLWPVLDRAWNQDALPPERVPGLLTAVRTARNGAVER